ncbi:MULTISPECIES: DUF3618 domain-containing protein [unclassified Nocardioides]|jgi:Protein of unknown function (DUF3618)|uniref:DUF3618 domain-containing protein n=1 Tax=Nocardioides sp. URHA0032 TaxID=1380388 RepID=UPI00056D15DB|nr:DUF3618 domain-containing protein [Nocardioides sp. URHA0032]
MSTNGTTPEQIEADIERQREQLAATIDELHGRLESKARSTARIAAVVAATALVGLVGLTVWRRTHHS